MNRKVLVTGGTGTIGRKLCQMLTQKGFHVSLMSRDANKSTAYQTYEWNVKSQKFDKAALHNVDYIINLAGAGVADKLWTNDRKQEIIDSRVKSAELIYHVLKSVNHQVKAVISASAVGFYGQTGDQEVTEKTIGGYDFLATTCRQWEHAVNKIKELNIRVVNMRIGVVLSSTGGALPKLATPVRYYLGAPQGTGKQFVPWVHEDDVCRAFIFALEQKEMEGAYNIVAPEVVDNASLTKEIGKVLNKPIWLPAIPAALLRFFLGDMASVVTEGNRVSCQKITDAGFSFQYPSLHLALTSILIDGKTNSPYSLVQA